MRNRKSSFEIWWHYRSDEQKEIVRVVGAFLFLIIVAIIMVFGPYWLDQLGIINLRKP
jgi:heme/copper-type cytochrome/quinol oxidase subunit 4